MNKGFTLVELAIVITIIGLLIGGVLKGQELLESARMTSTWNNNKAYESAVITFRDIYKALPGDILAPSNFLESCTASPCNIAGDNNGMIGLSDTWGSSTENEIFWIHLAHAKLANGIVENSAWVPTDHFGTSAPQPKVPIGARLGIVYLSPTWSARANPAGHFFHTLDTVIPYPAIMKYDLKFDDGKPLLGTILLHPSFALAADGINYDPNVKTPAIFVQRAGF